MTMTRVKQLTALLLNDDALKGWLTYVHIYIYVDEFRYKWFLEVFWCTGLM